MRKVLFAAGLIACGIFASAASAEVVVKVSKGRQAMFVYVDGQLEYSWRVSTGAWGYNTPNGVYRPTGFDPDHRSRQYHDAPMPYSIFFNHGYAIHGSYEIRHLGYPASHGCIRLHPAHAAELYDLVRSSNRTRIVVGR